MKVLRMNDNGKEALNYLKYVQQQHKNMYDVCEEEDWQSLCCTAPPFGNSFIEEEQTGICSKCYDGANFDDLNKEEVNE